MGEIDAAFLLKRIDEKDREMHRRLDRFEGRVMSEFRTLDAYRNRMIGIGIGAGAIGAFVINVAMKLL